MEYFTSDPSVHQMCVDFSPIPSNALILQTPAGVLQFNSNSDTIYLELASDPIDYGFSPTGLFLNPMSDDKHKARLSPGLLTFWLAITQRFPWPAPQVQLFPRMGWPQNSGKHFTYHCRFLQKIFQRLQKKILMQEMHRTKYRGRGLKGSLPGQTLVRLP